MSNLNDPGRPSQSFHSGMSAAPVRFVPVTTDMHPWMDDAECRKYVHRRSTGEGIDWFDLHPITAAKICDGCTVAGACAERVLLLIDRPETRPTVGVWAGKRFGKDAKEDAA